MWAWISSNSAVLNVIASFLTLGVWLFYAQLLFMGFVRQRRARLLINQGWGDETDSVCLVSNMSQEPAYIHVALLTLRTPDGEGWASITDNEQAETNPAKPSGDFTHQGPLGSGQMLNIGTFRQLILRAAKRMRHLDNDIDRPLGDLRVESFRITVLASYGPEGGLIGVQRDFYVAGADNERMQPRDIKAIRVGKRRARRLFERWMKSGDG